MAFTAWLRINHTHRARALTCIGAAVALLASNGLHAQEQLLVLGTSAEKERPGVTGALAAFGTDRTVLKRIDATSGATIVSVDLPGAQSPILLSPDGSRIVVGVANEPAAWSRGMRAGGGGGTGGETLTLLDAHTLKVLSTTWLGPGVGEVSAGVFSADSSRFTLLVRNFKAPKKIMIVHSAFATFDLATGDLMGWVAAPTPLSFSKQPDGRPREVRMFALPVSNAVLAVSAEERGTKRSTTTGLFLDLTASGLTLAETLTFDGYPRWTERSPDGRFILLAQRMGEPTKSAPEPLSRIQAINLESRQLLPPIELPGIVTSTRTWDPATHRLAVVTDALHASISAPGATVLVIPEGRETSRASLSGHLTHMGLLEKGDRFVAWTEQTQAPTASRVDASGVNSGRRELAVFDWPSFLPVAEPLHLFEPFLDSALTPDASRLVACTADGTFRAFDVAAARELPSVRVVIPKGPETVKRWAQFIGATAVTMAAGYDIPAGRPWAPPSPPPVSVLVRPDGGVAYVFDPEGGVLTTVEPASARIIATLSVQGRWASPVPGGRLIAIEDQNAVHLLGMTADKRLPDLLLPSEKTPDSFRMTPLSGTRLLLTRGQQACVIDGGTGITVSCFRWLRDVRHMLVVPAA